MFDRITQPFYNLSTRIKLFGGFGLVLMLTLGIALTGYQNLSLVTEEYQRLRLFESLGERMTDTRLTEKSYELTRETQYLEEVESQLVDLRREANALLETSIDPRTIPVMENVLEELDQYAIDFRQLVSGIENNASEAQMAEYSAALVTSAVDMQAVIDDYIATRDAEIDDTVAQSIQTILIVAALALVVGLLIAVVITSMISQPLSKLVDVMTALAEGDLEQELVTRRTDEMGVLMKTTNTMIHSLQDLIGRLGSGITQLASASEQMSSVAQENTRVITEQKNETDQ
ncbi:MAG TPA: methyl-accepting chemotaxis protein, partial [Saccharospirillum sp.]|nr:methyl-accepting chemotaxis protein [Saccharospirillum sp.]